MSRDWGKAWRRAWGHLVGPSELLVQLIAWLGLALVVFGLARFSGAEALGSQHWSKATSAFLVGGGLVVAVSAGLVDPWRQRRRRKRSAALPGGAVDPYLSALPLPRGSDLAATLLMLVDPSRYSPRTVERVCFLDGYYRHDVSRDFVIPDVAATSGRKPERNPISVLLPVLRLGRQGALADNLEVRSADGARLNTLNAGEYRAAMEVLMHTAGDALTRSGDWWARLGDRLPVLLRQVPFSHLRKPPLDDDERTATLEAIVDELRAAPFKDKDTGSSVNGDLEVIRERVIDLCLALATDHIVFVSARARPGDRIVVNYCFTAPHHARARLPLFRRALRSLQQRDRQSPKTPIGHQLGFLDSFRYRMGLRPHLHHVPITAHRWSQSYHLEFTSPQDTYVHECSILHSKAPPRPGSMVTFPPDGSRGADYVHVYVREAARTGPRGRVSMVAEIDCREKPPGLLGSVALLAVSQAFLIWIIGLHISRFFGPGERGTDLPALLLALPGLVAGWLGAQVTTERLRSCSISTLSALLATGVLAIGSTGTALSKSEGDTIGSVFGIAHPVWLALMVLSLGLTLDLAARISLRTRRYMKKIRFPDADRTIVV